MSERSSSVRVGAVASAAVDKEAEALRTKWFADMERVGKKVEGEKDPIAGEDAATFRKRLAAVYDQAYDQGATTDDKEAVERAKRLIDHIVANAGDLPQLDAQGRPIVDASGGFISGGQVKASKDFHVLSPEKIAELQSGNAFQQKLAADFTTNVQGASLRERSVSVFQNVYGVGYRENGNSNSGDVPNLLDANGSMWCGGAEWGIDGAVSGGQIYNQDTYLSAASFAAMGVKYHSFITRDQIKLDDPSTWPKPGDTIMVPGAGPSGLHPLTVGSVDEKTGMITVGAGNHSNQMARFTIHIGSARVQGFVSKDKTLMEKARRGEAVLDMDGMPVISMDQRANFSRPPHEWVPELYADQARVQAGRELGRILATGAKVDGVDIAAAVVKLGGFGALDLDSNKDGKITQEDIEIGIAQVRKSLSDKGITFDPKADDGKIDTIPEYIAAMAKAKQAEAAARPL